MRRVATGALLIVFVGMIVFRWLEGDHPAFGYLRAFCEAATVGALADWFAVVALFRHPLGIPNPHTAILPNNKDRLAESLADFVVSSFLTEERLATRVKTFDYAGALSRWLRENADFLAGRAAAHAPRILEGIPDEALARLLAGRARAFLGTVPLGPLLSGGLGTLVESGRDRQIFRAVLESTGELLASHRELIEQKIREEIPVPMEFLRNLPGFHRIEPVLDQIKDALASAVAKRTIEKVRDVLEDARFNPEHPLQATFVEKLGALIEDLKSSPQMTARIRGVQEAMLASAAIDEFSLRAWREVKAFLAQDCAAEDSVPRARLREALETLAVHLSENPDTRKELNEFIGAHALAGMLAARPQVHDLIMKTIQSWDAGEISNRLETMVGRDLQFIRLNGTIIGGVVGLVLHAGFAILGR